MEYDVSEPRECPFIRKDCDGFADGCEYDETECYDNDKFPDDCPLKSGDINVTEG